MIALRVCALGDLVVSGPLLERLGAPFLVAHAEHVALAHAAGWICGGIDADLARLHALHADPPEPARLAPGLRRRLAAGEPVLVLSRPGASRDALLRGLRAAGASDVRAHDPLPPPGVHAADHLASAAGPLAAPARPRIELPALGRAPRVRRPIALHPGAGSAAKRWPVEHWAALWHELRDPVEPRIVCGPADEAPARALAERLAAPILRTHTALDLAEALAGCRALLGHDSGVSHLAAALGLPTLALFGPTDPVQWAPRGPAAEWLRIGPDLTPRSLACEVRALLEKLRP